MKAICMLPNCQCFLIAALTSSRVSSSIAPEALQVAPRDAVEPVVQRVAEPLLVVGA